MLQQTQVKTVGPYHERWLERFPDTRSLASAELEELLKLWEGLGYYTRARNLHKAAKQVMDKRNGELPNTYADWLTLPGVGQYTAAAVASIAFGENVAAVDGNVLRVIARFTAFGESIDSVSVKKRMKFDLEAVIDEPGNFNQALMDLGREICTPKNPVCDGCPLKAGCLARTANQQLDFPVRKEKQPSPEFRIVVGLIRKGQDILIQQRKAEGLLGGLWEFPGGKVEDDEALEAALKREILEETGLQVEVGDEIATIRHVYSHFKIHLTAFWCNFHSGEVNLNAATQAKWVRQEDFDGYAFPKANLKILEALNL